MGGLPVTREWVSSMISKSIRASSGDGGKPPRKLSEMTDVAFSGLKDKQVLTYDLESNTWENKTPEKGTTVVANPSGEATTELKKLQVGNGIFSIPEGGGGGTVVEANPDASATDTLHKIKIGETVYKVPEGGGGGGSDPHQYSTVEQIVGTWIDGKDVYEVVSKEKPENCTVINKIATEIMTGMVDGMELVGTSSSGQTKTYTFNDKVTILYIGVQFNNKLQAVAAIDIVNNTIRQSTSDEITEAGTLIGKTVNVDHHSSDKYTAISETSYSFYWNNDSGYTTVNITLNKVNHTVTVVPGYSTVASSCFCNKINYYNIYTYIKN